MSEAEQSLACAEVLLERAKKELAKAKSQLVMTIWLSLIGITASGISVAISIYTLTH